MINACNQKVFLVIHKQNSEIQTLENLRDIFLPKLLNGEIRIK